MPPTSAPLTTTAEHDGREVGDAPVVAVEDLRKEFLHDRRTVQALDGVSLSVSAGEFVVLLGPSGCGKTTLLRAIAGLEKPTAGTIDLDGRTVYSGSRRVDVTPDRRALGMMFQSYALWPHMSVADNVAFPLRTGGTARRDVDDAVTEVLGALGIGELGTRRPGQLSGGQQQRVALARALVAGDPLVLFDEPLSNVDAQVRERLRLEILRLQRLRRFAAVYVTHDQTEALSLADRVVVLHDGRIAQAGTPSEVFFEPASRFVAHFIGAANLVPIVADPDGGVGERRVDTEMGPIVGRTSAGAQADPAVAMAAVWRPEWSAVTAEEPSCPNRWPGTVEHVVFRGATVEVHLRVADRLHMVVVRAGEQVVREGDEAWLSVPAEHVRFVPDGRDGG